MDNRKRILIFACMIIFLFLSGLLFVLITDNGAGALPEGYFVSLAEFCHDSTELYYAFFEVSNSVIVITFLQILVYGFLFFLSSSKHKLQILFFLLSITFIIITLILSIFAKFNGSEMFIILTSYFVGVLAFKNYFLSFLLFVFTLFSILNIKAKEWYN
ncbi:hypothetical protein GSF08_00125 [Clostridiaceae bacterium DONG20-135]|uniref:Uncharacterized protein n=1 Tax=Copranaerobaculum intestinale TaxID=2692629 RepID=A0A6N8U499_9FIRM|nr:hypothetical protein [Copranaerobaculum intestinale]MXQ72345.1 hypothetical protein [Copranaerobaculum intestinale]